MICTKCEKPIFNDEEDYKNCSECGQSILFQYCQCKNEAKDLAKDLQEKINGS